MRLRNKRIAEKRKRQRITGRQSIVACCGDVPTNAIKHRSTGLRRKVPEIFCVTFAMRRSRSAWLFVNAT